jgi:hypothetical protein
MDDPVSFTVHNFPNPDVQAPPRRQSAGRWKLLGILLACAAPVLASYFTYYVVRPQARSNYGELLQVPVPLPAASALALSTLEGRPVDPASLRDQWLLVSVGGGACDARCEHHLWLQRQLRETLGREKVRVDRVWLVNDSQGVKPELLPAMQGATVLRASGAQIAAWLQPGPGHTLEDHLYLVDPQGQWMMRFPAQADAKKMKRDLDRLLRAVAAWDLPGREGALRPVVP